MLTRRNFLRGAAGLSAALILPPSAAENAEAARRVWALGWPKGMSPPGMRPSAFVSLETTEVASPYFSFSAHSWELRSDTGEVFISGTFGNLRDRMPSLFGPPTVEETGDGTYEHSWVVS